jgi:hypothetical protein
MCQGCDEDAQLVASATNLPVATVNAVRNAYAILGEQRQAETEVIDLSGEDTIDLTDIIRQVAREGRTVMVVGGQRPDPELHLRLVRDADRNPYVFVQHQGLDRDAILEVLNIATASYASDGNGAVTEQGTIVTAPGEIPSGPRPWYS